MNIDADIKEIQRSLGERDLKKKKGKVKLNRMGGDSAPVQRSKKKQEIPESEEDRPLHSLLGGRGGGLVGE